MPELLSVKNIVKQFGVGNALPWSRRGVIHAVDGVSLDIDTGETVGLVGESGCGKSTLARVILLLDRPESGEVLFEGADVLHATGAGSGAYRRHVQMIFQDPYSSLNPRVTVGEAIVRAWRINHGVVPQPQWRDRAKELLQLVGLQPERVDWYPYQLSGGQRQRVAIARALAVNPSLVVCDEPVSALDVSVQAQVLHLLRDLQARLGVSYLFISHDLGVIRRIAQRVVVMYLGKVVETGTVSQVFERPGHPYTEALLSAIPAIDFTRGKTKTHRLLQGDQPDPINMPAGCRFRTRCPKAAAVCAEREPVLAPLGAAEHRAACHFPNVYDQERKDQK
jgi:oligopeptide/dipeptide ABC transporter ATP-binding protein